jgi:tRNA dimethylallyltransferase
MKPRVVAIVGPTCTGKTALSLRIGEQMPVEIVACDSRAVYRYFDIGTAKPTEEEQARVPHHLLDVADPADVYTVAQYRRQAGEAISSISMTNKLPLVVGGTGFYARALLEGLVIPKVPPQPHLRAELNAFAEASGNEALHQKLADLDPTTAAKLKVNDRFRVVRALEVTITAGEPFSALTRREEPPYDTLWIGLTANDRSILAKTIEDRFHTQMRDGMLEEVESLYKRFGANQSVMNTVNYKELVEHLEGKTSLADASELCMRHNRQLARRQLIWFRANPLITWFKIDEQSPAALASDVLNYINRSLN